MKLGIIRLATLTLVAVTVGAAPQACTKPLPPQTQQDVAAEVQCVTNELLSGINDPTTVARDCSLPTAEVARDLIAQLLGFSDKMASKQAAMRR